MRFGILARHDDRQIGALDRVPADRGGLDAVRQHDRIAPGDMDRRTFELLREEREEALGRLPGRPDSGELAQAGIDALAVERLCMRPDGTAELDARCDFDALRRAGQRLDLVAARMFRVLVGHAERTIETGVVELSRASSRERVCQYV